MTKEVHNSGKKRTNIDLLSLPSGIKLSVVMLLHRNLMLKNSRGRISRNRKLVFSLEGCYQRQKDFKWLLSALL